MAEMERYAIETADGSPRLGPTGRPVRTVAMPLARSCLTFAVRMTGEAHRIRDLVTGEIVRTLEAA